MYGVHKSTNQSDRMCLIYPVAVGNGPPQGGSKQFQGKNYFISYYTGYQMGITENTLTASLEIQ